MQTKFFLYHCRFVNDEGAWLTGYYDKDGDARPPAMMVKGSGIKEGDEISIAFLEHPATTQQIMGIVK